jgi:hypothetical protein
VGKREEKAMEDTNKLDQLFCRQCGKPIIGDGNPSEEGDAYCRQCMIEMAERHIQDREMEKSKWKRLRSARGWKITMVVLILLCLAVLAYQTPRILNATKGPKPIRMGAYDTDAKTDACIQNLWQISHRMQQGNLASSPELVCPASGKPYEIKKGAVPEAHCPNPQAHGLQDLLVTKKIPVPQLKK